MHYNLQWLILYASGLFFRNGSGSWISSSFKKTDKKNSRLWVACWKNYRGHCICPNKKVFHIEEGQIDKSNLAASKVAAWSHEKAQGMWSEAEKKQEVMISDWLNLCEGLTRSFSKRIINGALGSLTQKVTFDWFSSAAHTTHSQSKSSTISQMIEYERHSTKLVPKPAVTFQTNAVWLEETLVRFIFLLQ